MSLRKYFVGEPLVAANMNQPWEDLLVLSGYLPDGSDFAGFTKAAGPGGVTVASSSSLTYSGTAAEPYFGATTLADLLKNWRERESLPESGKELVSTLCGRKSTTRQLQGDSASLARSIALAAVSAMLKKDQSRYAYLNGSQATAR